MCQLKSSSYRVIGSYEKVLYFLGPMLCFFSPTHLFSIKSLFSISSFFFPFALRLIVMVECPFVFVYHLCESTS